MLYRYYKERCHSLMRLFQMDVMKCGWCVTVGVGGMQLIVSSQTSARDFGKARVREALAEAKRLKTYLGN